MPGLLDRLDLDHARGVGVACSDPPRHEGVVLGGCGRLADAEHVGPFLDCLAEIVKSNGDVGRPVPELDSRTRPGEAWIRATYDVAPLHPGQRHIASRAARVPALWVDGALGVAGERDPCERGPRLEYVGIRAEKNVRHHAARRVASGVDAVHVPLLVLHHPVDHGHDASHVARPAVGQVPHRVDVPAAVAAHGRRADHQEVVLLRLLGERVAGRTDAEAVAVARVHADQDGRLRVHGGGGVKVHPDAARVRPEVRHRRDRPGGGGGRPQRLRQQPGSPEDQRSRARSKHGTHSPVRDVDEPNLRTKRPTVPRWSTRCIASNCGDQSFDPAPWDMAVGPFRATAPPSKPGTVGVGCDPAGCACSEKNTRDRREPRSRTVV